MIYIYVFIFFVETSRKIEKAVISQNKEAYIPMKIPKPLDTPVAKNFDSTVEPPSSPVKAKRLKMIDHRVGPSSVSSPSIFAVQDTAYYTKCV